MKVVDVKTFVVGNPPPRFGGRYFIFVKLTTDTGITGIVGELHPEVVLAFGLEQPVALVELVLLPLDFA